jgi:hypothetical protein
MTNANLPDRWLADRRFRRDRLSDAGFRAYVNALMWSVGNRTDGVIEPGDLNYIPDFDTAKIPELIASNLWQRRRGKGSGWRIIDFATTQTGRDLLESYERRKAYDRQRKAKARNAKLQVQMESGGNSGGTCPPDSYSTDQNRPEQTQPSTNGEVASDREAGEVS